MEAVYVFLLRWDIPILFIATISLIVGLVKLVQARMIMRRAMFSLERDYGREQRQNGTALFFFALISIGILWYVNQIVAPSLPPDLLFAPTATLDPLKTPFASPSPDGAVTQQVTQRVRNETLAELAATVTLNPAFDDSTAVVDDTLNAGLEIQTPTQPPDVFIPVGGGCTPAVNISSPRPESTQTGVVEFIGTATNPNFAFYGLELKGPGTGNQWINLLAGGGFETIENGSLGVVDLGELEEGAYTVRLSIFGTEAEAISRCEINIFIGESQPTEN